MADDIFVETNPKPFGNLLILSSLRFSTSSYNPGKTYVDSKSKVLHSYFHFNHDLPLHLFKVVSDRMSFENNLHMQLIYWIDL